MVQPRVALVHDWLVSPGGAERLLYELHQIWPEAPIFTAAYVPERFPEFKNIDVRTTWLDRVPFAKTKHQFFPLLRGWAFKSLDLSDYDIVVSSCSAESKYVRTGKNTLHVCYCHTPVRYYWSDYEWYLAHPPFGKLNGVARIALRFLVGYLRKVDLAAAKRVDVFIANSQNVKARIQKYYGRDSTVIYPPIVTSAFRAARNPKDYYVIIGRQVAYKRLDLAVDTFNELGWKLKVIGAGEEVARQKARAKSNIEFLGRVSDADREKALSEAKGFVFGAEEDFGMAPTEALAAGCPVIAYAKGGALEFMIPGVNGVLFERQTPKDLIAALREFDESEFDETAVRASADKFDVELFKNAVKQFVGEQYDLYLENRQKTRDN